MICKTQVKPFDVLIKNRKANMISVDCAINWSTNVRSNERKGDPQLTNSHQQRKNCNPGKQLTKQ